MRHAWLNRNKPSTGVLYVTGFPGKPGDMNFICPGPEITWNLPKQVGKPGPKRKLSRKHGQTWIVKDTQHFNSILRQFFSNFCAPAILERPWDLPFGAKNVLC